MRLAEGGQQRRDVPAAEAKWGGDAQMPAHHLAAQAECLGDAVEFVEHRLPARKNDLARLGKAQVPGGALDQYALQALFELTQALRHGGAGHIEFAGSGCERVRSRHGHEEAQIRGTEIRIRVHGVSPGCQSRSRTVLAQAQRLTTTASDGG